MISASMKRRVAACGSCFVFVLLLAGCGASSGTSGLASMGISATQTGAGGSSAASTSSGAGAAAASGEMLEGVLHGGQFPIIGAAVTLYAAGVPDKNAPLQLGTATSDDSGNFTFSGFTCPSSDALLYIVASRGNSTATVGGPVNFAIKLMAAIGPCASRPSLVEVNELTTVAAVYALNAFSYVDSSTAGFGGCVDCAPPAQQSDMTQLHGNEPAIANAFATAGLLADVETGGLPPSLPPVSACAPGVTGSPVNCATEGKITALANSLAACVNTATSTSFQCKELFSCALPGSVFTNNCQIPPGTQTVPSDTLAATLSIARNAGTVAITGIFDLATRNVVFAPGLNAAPTDWTVALNFDGGGLNFRNEGDSSVAGIAVDAQGNAWIVDQRYSPQTGADIGSSVIELNPVGTPLSGATGFTGGGLNFPFGIAIDLQGDAWITNFVNGSVTELGPTGAPLSPSVGFYRGGFDNPLGVAIDSQGNVWIANLLGRVTELDSTGNPVAASGFAAAGSNAIAIDARGDAWLSSYSDATELNSSGIPLSPPGGFTGGGLNSSDGIAVDPSGNVWLANESDRMTELSATGSALSPSSGYVGGGLNLPQSIAIDSQGNVWVGNSGSVTELNSSGNPLSPASGFTAGGHITGVGLALDGAGDVWVSSVTPAGPSVTEFVGAAAPTLTPLVAQITKPAAALTSIAVTPASASLAQGATQQLTVTGTYADGSTRNITASATWTSSDPSTATVSSPGGLVTGVATGGPVTITASVTDSGQTLTATASLTVTAPVTYTVGGMVTGLTASGLVLQDNGGDDLTVGSGAGTFTFATALSTGASYQVTIQTQPAGETCGVTNGAGTIASSNITNVSVTCTSAATFTVGGTIGGLTAAGLVLLDNGGDALTVASSASQFQFATQLSAGSAYAVTVQTQPSGESCTVINGTGTIASSNVNVSVLCLSSPASLACNAAPSPQGGGAQPYDNQTYCGTFSGQTDQGFIFTGILTFTTPTAPGSISGCQFLASATPPSSQQGTVGPITCTGTTDGAGNVNIVVANTDDAFIGTFSSDGTTATGTFNSSLFGPGSGMVGGGAFNVTEQQAP